LTIKERGPHSQTVPYVKPGRDATVAYGLRDFRFVNSNTSPVGIALKVNGSRLTVQVYGSSSDRKEVKLYTGRLTRVAAGSKTVVDASLPVGSRKVVVKGARGYRVMLYRTITQPDGTVTTDTFRSSYAPQSSVVAVGASPPPVE
jgi:vancomycin resistance protein VanW